MVRFQPKRMTPLPQQPPGALQGLLSPEEKKRIVEALQSRGALLPCPRCTNPNFTLFDYLLSHSVYARSGAFIVGGPSLPVLVVICNRCGFVAEHALGSLGLMDLSQLKTSDSGLPK